jgi:hypothetical protein
MFPAQAAVQITPAGSFAESVNTAVARLSPVKNNRARWDGRGGFVGTLGELKHFHPVTFGQVVLIQFAAAVDSL